MPVDGILTIVLPCCLVEVKKEVGKGSQKYSAKNTGINRLSIKERMLT